MKTFRIVLTLLLGLMSTFAVAQRALAPIIDYKDQPVTTGSGKPVSAGQVRDAIVAAGKRLNWQMAFAANDGLVGTLVVNNKHTISVEIGVAATRYSVKYRSSVNMRYGVTGRPPYPNAANAVPEGLPGIHPAYNDWVKALVAAINDELKTL